MSENDAAHFIAEWERLRALREASDEPVVTTHLEDGSGEPVADVSIGEDWSWISARL